MDDVLRPFVAHELEDLLELLEVQVLLRSDHVDVLIEVVSVFSVFCTSQVSGDVQGGTVRFEDRCRRQAVRLQIDDHRALGFYQQVLLFQGLHDSRHLVGVERLARIGIIGDPQHIVNAGEFLEGFIAEPLPELGLFRFAVFQLGEGRSCFIVQRRIFFGLCMELGIVMQQGLDRFSLDVFLIAPAAISDDHLAELRAVVAEMVDPRDLIAHRIV